MAKIVSIKFTDGTTNRMEIPDEHLHAIDVRYGALEVYVYKESNTVVTHDIYAPGFWAAINVTKVENG